MLPEPGAALFSLAASHECPSMPLRGQRWKGIMTWRKHRIKHSTRPGIYSLLGRLRMFLRQGVLGNRLDKQVCAENMPDGKGSVWYLMLPVQENSVAPQQYNGDRIRFFHLNKGTVTMMSSAPRSILGVSYVIHRLASRRKQLDMTSHLSDVLGT
jgi:hypothetical protein